MGEEVAWSMGGLAGDLIRASHAPCTPTARLPPLPDLPLPRRLRAPGLPADRCDNKVCLEDPLVVGLTNRMSDVALVPPNNSEFIQLLRQPPHPRLLRARTTWTEARPTVLPAAAQVQGVPAPDPRRLPVLQEAPRHHPRARKDAVRVRKRCHRLSTRRRPAPPPLARQRAQPASHAAAPSPQAARLHLLPVPVGCRGGRRHKVRPGLHRAAQKGQGRRLARHAQRAPL